MSHKIEFKHRDIIQFFKDRPNLDVENTIAMILNLYKQVENNIQIDHKNNEHSFVLENIQKSLQSIAHNNKKTFIELKEDIKNSETKIMYILSDDRDKLIQQIRETMKSNNVDSHKEIKDILNNSQSVLNDKLIEIIGKTDSSEVLECINMRCEELKKEINETTNGNHIDSELLDKIEGIIVNKYKSQEKTMSVIMDTYFKTRETNEHVQYSDIITKLDRQEKEREEREKIMENVDKYLSRQAVSSLKGKQGEKRMIDILTKLHPDAEVDDTSGKTGCGDVILRKPNKPDILFDTKDYNTSIPIEQIDKILRDMNMNNCHGILVSHNSGIATKEDMYIGEDNKKLIVYIHYCQYSPEKIAMAINAIYYLDKQIQMNKDKDDNGITISDHVLEKINNEYKVMAQEKEGIIKTLKKNTEEVIKSVTNMNMSSLSSFLNERYQNTTTTEHRCNICNNFNGKNAKSLSAHQGTCKKKMSKLSISNDLSGNITVNV